MRGSTPLDVAAASCIDNNELALALQEQDLEMVWEDLKKKKNLQERKTHESVQWTHLIISNLVVPHLCGDIGGDILGRLWAADVSNAPF